MATLHQSLLGRLAAAIGCFLLVFAIALATSDGAAAAWKGHSHGAKATVGKSPHGKAKKHKARPRRSTPTPTAPTLGSASPASGLATTPAATPATPGAAPAPTTSVPVAAPPPATGEVTIEVGSGESSRPCAGPAPVAASVSVGLGTFSAMARPTSCWRPYAASSPFNTSVAADPELEGGSSAQISRLLSGGAISYFVAGDPARDFGTAVYYPQVSDPVYTVHCTEGWGRCALEGEEVHLPAGAIPSGPWPIGNGDADSHMTLVDQENGWEYDFWNVREIGGGRIVTKWGGKTRIEGDGLGSDAVAAQFGTLAGIIRPSEMRSGVIDHALVLTVPCTVGFVAPATKGGLECADAGMSTADALPMGAHLQLRMSEAEIEALDAPVWKKGILRALSTYGAYVEDTTGDSSQWGLKFESPNGSTSQGGPDEYVELAKSLGMEPEDYNGNGYPEYWFNVAGGVDWSKLRVIG